MKLFFKKVPLFSHFVTAFRLKATLPACNKRSRKNQQEIKKTSTNIGGASHQQAGHESGHEKMEKIKFVTAKLKKYHCINTKKPVTKKFAKKVRDR